MIFIVSFSSGSEDQWMILDKFLLKLAEVKCRKVSFISFLSLALSSNSEKHKRSILFNSNRFYLVVIDFSKQVICWGNITYKILDIFILHVKPLTGDT